MVCCHYWWIFFNFSYAADNDSFCHIELVVWLWRLLCPHGCHVSVICKVWDVFLRFQLSQILVWYIWIDDIFASCTIDSSWQRVMPLLVFSVGNSNWAQPVWINGPNSRASVTAYPWNPILDLVGNLCYPFCSMSYSAILLEFIGKNCIWFTSCTFNTLRVAGFYVWVSRLCLFLEACCKGAMYPGWWSLPSNGNSAVTRSER